MVERNKGQFLLFRTIYKYFDTEISHARPGHLQQIICKMFEGCKTLVVLDGWMGGSNMMISLFVVVVMVWPV